MTSQIGMCDCASGQYWDSGSSQCVSVLSCGYTCTQDLTYPDYQCNNSLTCNVGLCT